jgi:hypothetical protein
MAASKETRVRVDGLVKSRPRVFLARVGSRFPPFHARFTA